MTAAIKCDNCNTYVEAPGSRRIFAELPAGWFSVEWRIAPRESESGGVGEYCSARCVAQAFYDIHAARQAKAA